ncbi:hypothetical protein [Actinokineospora sp. UTMC 2448]|uniref:DUF7919 family protein n=1 Tax=Actinokineospora sp. UTMC 2448 TaxID=2268449 RepID=UPI0021649F2B|nr:hypothetical protein [Actinokineospora sp. UTMC 2448]UVS78658.1 hypothetical protein Actkin_02394 [Actinokineospora sp. UTMC 2448]
MVAVGWLDPRGGFPVGEADPRLLPALTRLCYTHEQNLTRACYQCPYCLAHHVFRDVPEIPGARPVLLGNAEIHIVGPDGVAYAAPTLVVHYVEEHGYLPPRPFVEAALWVDARTPRELQEWDR